jgi:hypothetical protein
MKHKLFFYILISCLAASCVKSETRSLAAIEKDELSKGIRNDSLFLGFYLGMLRSDFFALCLNMNKQGKLREGDQNMTAVFQLDNKELDYPGQMGFYPHFINDKISSMPLTFRYNGWAPWNENLQSSKLIIDVKKLLEKWYNTKFTIMVLENKTKGLVSIEGNRRITITVFDDREVLATIDDLTVKK